MHRSLLLSLILVLAAALGGIWWLTRGETVAPPPPGGSTTEQTHSPSQETGAVSAAVGAAAGRASEREVIAARPAALLEDPEIQAGLTGFKGRVVSHEKVPVAECGVRLYRGALDSVLVEGMDVFADEPTFTPQYVAGETKTGADGTFLIAGVWPRAFYLLFAGIGTDAPMHQIVTRTPSPGEIVDLGDIVLPDAGVIVGTVLDDNGDPLPGALVRAADLPGSLAAFFPVERFDPEGALLVREPQSPVKVLEMPKWVKPAFDNLPIPSAHTDGEGRFRLVGVIPGSNLLATTVRGYLSDLKPSIQVRAGQVKDVGRIKLKRGEELTGRVLDSAGKPVADAEIIAGSTLSMAPVDLAQRLDRSDAEGRFQGQGFAPGKVTVAARRGRGHAWVLAEPQPVIGDVLVTLPATFTAAVGVTLADGQPCKEPRFRLLQGRAGDGAAEMHMMGFVPPIDLRDRQKPVADGQWRIENLGAGWYTLVADAPGCATSFAAFEIAMADVVVNLQLQQPRVFTVRVQNQEDKPVRNASIFAEARGTRLVEMPVNCGRTGADGILVIDKLQADSLRVSAEHPRWGVVHGEAKVGEELVLRMQPPGALRGTLLENGKTPEPGRFTVALMHQRGNGPRGPLDQVPGLITPGLDGAFAVAALQPGTYQLSVVKSLDALRSPGGVFALAQDMFMMRNLPEQQVEIVAGQTSDVQLDAGEKPIEGPTGTIGGSVTVDGKLGSGYMVSAYGGERRFSARVDERGRFDLGIVPAGDVWVSVMGNAEAGLFMGPGSSLWSASLKLQPAEAKDLTIEVTTSSMAGVCYLPDGSPAAGVFVQAQGKLRGSGENQGEVWLGAPTDAQGAFRFAQVAEGTWSLNVRGGGKTPARGRLEGIVVNGGVPVDSLRVELQAAMVVKGRVEMAAFGAQKPRWAWIGFYRIDANTKANEQGQWADGVGINGDEGTFSTDDLSPGRYRIRIHAQFESDGGGAEFECQDIEVPAAGLADLLLRPGKRLG